MQSKEEVDADTSGDEAEEEPHGHKVHLVWKQVLTFAGQMLGRDPLG